MQFSSHLQFSGQCEAAFKLYERCFAGKIATMLTYAETPAAHQVPPAWRNKIIHATLVVGEQVLMGCDASPEHFKRPQGFSVSIGVKEPEEAERIFKALSENATVIMALEKTFWSVRFGMLVDQFGIPWMINCEQAP
jgi:PhnB protein